MGDFPSEVLFSFLFVGLLRRGTFPSPKKYPKGRWGDPGPGHPLLAFGQFTLQPPFFIQSDTYKGDTRLPLNFCRACGHLVTGAVGYALRLTALGLKVASCFADGSRSVSRRRRKHDIETKIRLPLQKAVRRSPTRSPPQIGCPKESGRFCGCAASSPEASDWIKESKTLVLACFWILFARAKSIPGFGGGAPVNQPRVRGRGGPGAKPRSGWLRKKRPAGKTKQRLCLTKRQRRERPLRYHSSCPGNRGHSSL